MGSNGRKHITVLGQKQKKLWDKFHGTVPGSAAEEEVLAEILSKHHKAHADSHNEIFLVAYYADKNGATYDKALKLMGFRDRSIPYHEKAA